MGVDLHREYFRLLEKLDKVLDFLSLHAEAAGKTRPVDSSGHLPRGEEFQTFAEFKQTVAARYQQDMVRGLLKNLVLYGTGRRPDIRDMQTIRATMNDLELKGYPLRDLVEGGKVRPAVTETYPLAEAPQAIRDLRAGKIRGEAVILVEEG